MDTERVAFDGEYFTIKYVLAGRGVYRASTYCLGNPVNSVGFSRGDALLALKFLIKNRKHSRELTDEDEDTVLETSSSTGIFPEDDDLRKQYPVFTGCVMMFPSAIAQVAHHSYLMNKKHCPDLKDHETGWDPTKSIGDGNQQLRHMMESTGGEGLPEARAAAWRALETLERMVNKLPPYDKESQ